MKKIYLTSLIVVVVVAISAYAYFTYSCKFSLSEKCSGYNFAKDNKLADVSECKYANKPYFETNMSDEFMAGCREFF